LCVSLYFSILIFFLSFFFLLLPPPPRSTLFPYTTLFRSIVRSTRSNRQNGNARYGRSLANAGSGGRLWDCPKRLVRLHPRIRHRSEEHTSELQSLRHLVCRLLLEKKKKQTKVKCIENMKH